MNMSQSFNKLGEILKEYCKQDNESYQMDFLLPERDSRNAIKQNVHAYINTKCSYFKNLMLYFSP